MRVQSNLLNSMTSFKRKPYRELNAKVPKAPIARLRRLLSRPDSSPIRGSKKVIQKPLQVCRKKRIINDGFKLAMVQMVFGSLEDLSEQK